jgi:hypothetical protein
MNEKYDLYFMIMTLILFMAEKFIYLDDMHISYYHDYIKSVITGEPYQSVEWRECYAD